MNCAEDAGDFTAHADADAAQPERAGLVGRTVYPVVPPKTEYALTELGRSVIAPLRNLCLWAERYSEQIRAHQLRYARPAGRAVSSERRLEDRGRSAS